MTAGAFNFYLAVVIEVLESLTKGSVFSIEPADVLSASPACYVDVPPTH
jgi:hypothetical protein